jgi:hypothetical protein
MKSRSLFNDLFWLPAFMLQMIAPEACLALDAIVWTQV